MKCEIIFIKMWSALKYGFLSLILLASSSVLACSPPLGEVDHLAESDLVFVGEVVQAGKFKSNELMMGVDLLVLFSIKGEDLDKVRIRSNIGGVACGYESSRTFRPGSYWLIFANDNGEFYRTSSLAGNQPFEDMGEAVLAAESLLAETFLYATLTETIEEETTSMGFDDFTLPFDDFDMEPEDTPMVADSPVMVSNHCKVDFDGCDTCVYDEATGERSCTQNICQADPLAAPVCLLYFREMEDLFEKGPFYKSDTDDGSEVDYWQEVPETDIPGDLGFDGVEGWEDNSWSESNYERVPRVTPDLPTELSVIEDLGLPTPPPLVEEVPPEAPPIGLPSSIDGSEQSLYEDEHRLRHLMTSLIFWN